MTVETNDTVERYPISGVGPYAFSFRIFADSDLQLVALSTDTPPEVVPLTLSSHYTVSGANDQDGGSVTLTAGAASTYSGYTLDIRSNISQEQPTSVRNQGRFLPEIHEDAFDRLSRQVQDLSRRVDASFRYPDNMASDGALSPIQNWISKYLAIGPTGELEPVELTSSGALTSSIIAGLLDSLVRTTAEIAAGVTPVNYAYPPLGDRAARASRYASTADALLVLKTGDVTREVYYLEDWGAPCNGTDDDSPAFRALLASLYSLDIHETSNSRRAMPVIQLPAKALRLKTDLDLGDLSTTLGMMGLTIRGCGAWATAIYIDAGITITGKGTSNLTWEHIAFRSDEIDDDVVLFTISTAGGGALRRWTYNHCDFFNVYECFNVTGSALCDEFKFVGCHFLECYRLINNGNDQAVNWNFWACDYEATLDSNTTKDLDDAVMLLLSKGMVVNWYGGSIIINGQMVLMNTSSAGSFSSVAHFINFDGVKLELMDNADSPGTHSRLVMRSGSYSGANALKFTLQNFAIVSRGTLPATLDLFELFNNWTVVIRNGEIEGGYVVGVIDSNTSTQNGVLIADNVLGLLYREDTTNRALSHHQHNVTLIPPNLSDTKTVARVQRSGGTSGVVYTQPQRVYVSGTTGSLPEGGTTVNLPAFYAHARLCELVLQQYATTSNNLTVQLRDQADTTTYASVALVAGSGPREARAAIAQEIGYQIGTEATPVPLMLKFVGTAEVQKGVVWLEYM